MNGPAGQLPMQWTAVVEEADQLGESPFWHPQEQRLYWVDIPGFRIRRLDPATGAVESWGVPSEPGCIAPARNGGLVIALRDGIYRGRNWGGALDLISRFAHDPATTRFNDGKADPEGRFWAGTMYEPRDARKAQLYSIDMRVQAGGPGQPSIALKAQNAVISNGLAWSPDAKVVYWADTPTHAVQAWDWDRQTNGMTHHREFVRVPGKPDGWKPGDAGYGGRPDGAAVDAEGNYWVAMFEGQRLLRFSAAGEQLAAIAVPVLCPTMPCFGGIDLKTLYVTSASYKRPEDELKQFPLSGRVLATQVDVPGLPVNFVSD